MERETTASAARPRASLRRVRADLLLLHAPAFFDFRDRGDVYFPYLSTSGDVPITPLYEYFPLGFKTLERYLAARGRSVAILNLATVLLRHPRLDVGSVIDAIDAPVVGIDLHWMVHAQGSLELAALVKARRPDVRVLFGGISATYFARELIARPEVDLVMRGYDTHEPVALLLDAVARGRSDLRGVPNLLWKEDGAVVDNGVSHAPDAFSCGIDWSHAPPAGGASALPIREVVSTQNAGCAYACGWCGGSRDAFRRIYGRRQAMARKPRGEIGFELGSLAALPGGERYHLYSVGSYNEPRGGLDFFLDQVAGAGVKSVSYEQFHLTPDDVLRRMAAANSHTTITLSPESHDLEVARLAGRGVYTPAEMEAWIERALDAGIHRIDVWYFVGMPAQGPRSVRETVEYCGRLLRRFPGGRVVPLVCPMIPLLDPASEFFEHPERHGYRVFYRTLEEHRRGLGRASLIHRINYETRWLRREELVRVGYGAVRELTLMKAEARLLPRSTAGAITAKIDDALALIDAVHAADCVPDARDRARAIAELAGVVRAKNHDIFFGGVSNQAFPLARQIGGRWFDETLWSAAELEAAEGRG